jgi:hypothetical protein
VRRVNEIHFFVVSNDGFKGDGGISWDDSRVLLCGEFLASSGSAAYASNDADGGGVAFFFYFMHL